MQKQLNITIDDYEYYAETLQLMGREGITQPCLDAIAAILTSAFHPPLITAVLGRFGSDDFEKVMFVVWNWFTPGITLVLDGFGTHGGTGGRGLSSALGLIKFYNIPLEEVRISNKDAFFELVAGTLSEAMFARLLAAIPSRWSFYKAGPVRKIANGTSICLEVREPDDHDRVAEIFILKG